MDPYGSTSILRVKRKADDVPPDDILLERRPEKRRSIAALLSGVSIEDRGAVLRERYHRLTLATFMTLERQLPPDKLAALMPNLRFEASTGEGNQHDGASIPFLNTRDGGRTMGADFTVYDVLLKPGKSTDRPHLVAMRANSADQAEETSEAGNGDAAVEDRDAVYDLYVQLPQDASTDDEWQSSATVVQLMDDDGDLWAEETEDSNHDSEDSNAEDYYANDYPDEESDWDASHDSDSDDDERGSRSSGDEEYGGY